MADSLENKPVSPLQHQMSLQDTAIERLMMVSTTLSRKLDPLKSPTPENGSRPDDKERATLQASELTRQISNNTTSIDAVAEMLISLADEIEV